MSDGCMQRRKRNRRKRNSKPLIKKRIYANEAEFDTLSFTKTLFCNRVSVIARR